MFSARYSSRVLGVGAARAFCASSSRVLLLEGVGDVLEEDQAEDDVLVLGRVHVVAELVGGGPERGLEAEIPSVLGGLGAACLGLLRRLLLGSSLSQGQLLLAPLPKAEDLCTRTSFSRPPRSRPRASQMD